MSRIADVHARQILDSRGNPTVEVDVRLESGALGRAAVPSGASTGVHEAVELRDGGAAVRRQGRHAGGRERQRRDRRRASPAWTRPTRQALDRLPRRARRHAEQGPARRERDPRRLARGGEGGRGRRRRARSTATSAATEATTLPVPMMNVINGGVHAENSIDLQEFMVVPAGAETFAEALRIGAEIYHALKKRARTSAGSRRRSATRAASRPTCRSSEDGDRGDPRGGRARRPPRRRSRSRSTRRRASSSATAPTASRAASVDAGRAWPTSTPASSTATRSSRSRTASPRTTGTAWRATDRAARRPRPARRRRPLRHEPGAAAPRHRRGRRATRSSSR